MVQEANVMCEALRDVTQEERRLREYTSVTRVALDTTDEEVGEARTAAVAAEAELASKLDSAFFGFYLI
jgi:hypothetical protein